MNNPIFTIGHSTHSIGRFIELLKRYEITAVCDVRSKPVSRMNPQYNESGLSDALRSQGIVYVFLGKELGARPSETDCYRDGKVQYDLLARTESFKKGIRRILRGAKEYRLALMCAEKDPLYYHRAILVARRLVSEGATVSHVLADDTIESHGHMVDRLIDHLKLQNMLWPPEEIVVEAYRIQGEAIAYKERGAIGAA